MKSLLLIYVVVILLTCGSWCVNLYRLVNCDFKDPYRGEILYSLGVVAPTFYVTAWMDLDKGAEE